MMTIVRLSRLNRLILILLLAVTSLIPFVVSSVYGTVDPFTHGEIASTILLIKNGVLVSGQSNIEFTPAVGVLLAGSSFATGIPVQILAYSPIAGTFAVLTVFVLARRLMRDTIAAMLVVNVLSYRFYSPFLFGTWPHSFGYTFFLLFVFVFARYSGSRSPSLLILLLLVFFGNHFYSYNGELWIVAFLLFAEFARLILHQRDRTPTASLGRLRSTSSLVAAIVVTFVTFNQVIYGAYIPRFSAVQSEWTVTFRYYISVIFRTVPPVKYAYVPAPSPPLLLSSNVAWLSLAYVPLLVGIVVAAKNRAELRQAISSGAARKWLIVGALIMVWPVDILIYLPIGAAAIATTRYLTFIAPLVSPLALVFLLRHRIRIRKTSANTAVSVYLAVLALLAVASFGLTMANGYWVASPVHYTDADSGARWLFSESPSTSSIFSDQNTQGEYAIVSAAAGKWFFSNNLYNSSSFSQLVNPTVPPSTGGYFHGAFLVVNLNLANTSTKAGGWLDFQPLSPYLSSINGNPAMSEVYDDGNSWILSGV